MKRLFFAMLTAIVLFASCDDEKVTSLVLSERQKTMTMGDIDTLEVTVYPLTAMQNAKITWETSNESVVSVSNNGIIQAHTPGEAIVGAISGKVYVECKITVLAVKADFTFYDACLYLHGDKYKKNTNNLDLYLLEEGLVFDENGIINGEGFFLKVSLNQSLQDSQLVANTFKNDTTGKALTFFPGSNTEKYAPGTFLGLQVEQSTGAIFIKNGSLNVEKNNNLYNLLIDFTGKSGEIISGKYSGEIPILDLSGGNIEERITNYSIAKVREQTVINNLSQIRLMLLSDSDSLQLVFNTPIGTQNSIPVGDYLVSDSKSEFHLQKGSTDEGNTIGCWSLGSDCRPITSGNVTVDFSTNKYIISYHLEYENTRITGRYSGVISF